MEKTQRNLAIDAYRGFVMLLMMAEVLELSRVSKALPGNPFWSFLAFHQTHSAWVGCSLHDTIQPGFSFLAGVALPYSIASRLARGETFRKLFAHALWRGLLLVALGIFLRSLNAAQTYFTFEDTLTQIGLGYPLLFLIAWRPPKWQWTALGVILFGYWLAWALLSLIHISRLFVDSSLIRSNNSPGTKLAGGFARFPDITQALNRDKVGSPVDESLAGGPSIADASPHPKTFETATLPAPTETLFRASSNLVEVYATVTDSHGRYVDDLTAKEFAILEGAHSQSITAFENHTANVSVALLFDTTSSMEGALPSLKSAALRLLEELRPDDSVAVYGFNDHVAELQRFTTDKVAAKRAVLRAHALGSTALYDALLRVNHDLAARAGKKVIIVFTDGDDNSSMLTADDVIQRAKTLGVPIYTIAEGEALDLSLIHI